MSPLELREKIHAQLDQIPEVELPKIQQYLDELTTVPTEATSPPHRRFTPSSTQIHGSLARRRF
jgi:hypothetical protein